MSIADLRRDYGLSSLSRKDLAPDPIAEFQRWFAQAAAAKAGSRLRKIGIAFYKFLQVAFGADPVDPNAMALATVGTAGRPSVRTVLLKGVDRRGFIFYTNYQSRKGGELGENPHAALAFYWSDLERQVCVAGPVTKLPREESEAYFSSRPRGSRIAAWASNQSGVVASRNALEQRWKEIETQFSNADVPLPPFWGGYVLAPERIEFWQGRPSRLHDRFCYTKQEDGSWGLVRLAP